MISLSEHEALRLGRSLADVLLKALAATEIPPDDQRMLWVGLVTELEQYCEGMIGNGDAHAVLRDTHERVLTAYEAIRCLTDVDALDSLAFGLRGYLTSRRTKLVAAHILDRLAVEAFGDRYGLLRWGVRRQADALLKHREWLRYRRFAP
jgi:hypothetical protein